MEMIGRGEMVILVHWSEEPFLPVRHYLPHVTDIVAPPYIRQYECPHTKNGSLA